MGQSSCSFARSRLEHLQSKARWKFLTLLVLVVSARERTVSPISSCELRMRSVLKEKEDESHFLFISISYSAITFMSSSGTEHFSQLVM
jgi:hypothetical protein